MPFPMVSLPTGTGKTIIFAYIVRRIAERGGRSLVLVHRDELLNQAEDKLKMIWPEAEIGVVKASRNELDIQSRLPIRTLSTKITSKHYTRQYLGVVLRSLRARWIA